MIINAGKKHGIKVKAVSQTPSDAAYFFKRGIHTPNLGCGERNPHTNREYLDLKDFFNCANIVVATVASFRD